MRATATLSAREDLCRTPLDTRYFDESAGQVTALSPGLLQLARFELPFGYCGSLEGFWQFTNEHARNNAEISTPGIEWLLLINGQPVAPAPGELALVPGLYRIGVDFGASKTERTITVKPGARLKLQFKP